MLAEGPVGYSRLGEGDQRGAARGGEGRAAHVARAPGRRGAGARAPRRQRAGPRERPLVRAHRVPEGERARRLAARRPGRGEAGARRAGRRRSGATACSSSCGTTATRSTGTATTRWRRSRCAPASKWSRPTTCTTPRRPGARSRPRSPRCGPAVRSTRSTAGCPAAPFAHLRSAARAGTPLRALAGRGRAHGRHRRRVRVRPAARRAAPARLPRARRAQRDVVAARARPARCGRLLPAVAPHYEQAMRQIEYELTVIEQLGFPGYFLLLHDIVEFCRRSRHLLPGAGERGEQRGVLRARRHQGRRGRARVCCSSGSCRPNATARPTSTSTSSTSGAKR